MTKRQARALETPPKSPLTRKKIKKIINDWKKKPYNPNNLPGTPGQHLVKANENLKRIAAQYHMSWQKLTRYNWGTSVPRKVNWYLRVCCKCHKRTPDGKNYVFTNSICPSKKKLSEWLWFPPVKQKTPPPTPPTPTPTTRKKKNKINTPTCPHKEDDRCKLDWDEKNNEHPVCEWPNLVEIRDIKLGTGEEEKQRLKSMQHLENVYLSLNRYNIHRRKATGEYEEHPHEKISHLMFGVESASTYDMSGLQSKMKSKSNQAIKGASSGENWTGTEPILKPDVLEGVAEYLREMHEARVLERVVVRGFADKQECNSAGESLALSERRAQWVVDQLTNRFRLLLSKEPGTGSKQAISQTQINMNQQRLKVGFTPVQVVGCGWFFASLADQNCVSSKPHQLVVVEVETRPPGSRAPEESSENQLIMAPHQWHLYEYMDGSKKVLYATGNEHNGLAKGPVTVELMINEALDYVCLIEEITDPSNFSEAQEAVLGEIKKWIREEWKFNFGANIPQMSKFYTDFTEFKDKKGPNSVLGAECANGTPPPWIRKSHHGPADHARILFETTNVPAYVDIMKEKVSQQGAEEELVLPPLVLRFKKGEPPKP